MIDCLCCIPKFQTIYNVMDTLTIDELIILKQQLTEHSKNHRLNQFLELEFKNRLGK